MRRHPPSLVLIWLDALPGDLLREMYWRGELPNLAEYFEDGVFIEHAISCLPTVSESNEGGIATGLFAGETNMLGERYFSRRRATMMHYKYNARPDDDFGGRLRARSIDAVVGDAVGMGRLLREGFTTIVDLVASHYERSGSLRIVERRLEAASRVARSRKPRLLFFTVSADYIAHVSGSRGAELRAFLREFDKCFPMLAEALREAYGEEGYAVFVFSDHGVSDVSRHLNLPSLLEGYGFRPLDTGLISEQECDVAALSNGRRSGLVYVAHPSEGWRKRPSYKLLRNYPLRGSALDLPGLLAREEGVDLVLLRRGKSVVIVSRDGEAVIEHDSSSGKYRYRVLKGDDPLAYGAEGVWMSEEEWLRASYRTEHPDLIVQAYNLFKSPNCGDLVLTAAEGWDFWEEWDVPYPRLRASHGGFSRAEMDSFVLGRGPCLREGVVPVARLLDLYATIVTYYRAGHLAYDSHAVERLVTPEPS
ncbi:MAG: hypothetical protein DRJ67_02915 [Thermoprotei archaeon]|nr:MAG: hypothetical protein DRJ67_02915 [Thermoprotei archaeon]